MKKNISLLIIVCLLIIILVAYRHKKEGYKVYTDIINTSNIKTIGETYDYPSCMTNLMCTTQGNMLKPRFK